MTPCSQEPGKPTGKKDFYHLWHKGGLPFDMQKFWRIAVLFNFFPYVRIKELTVVSYYKEHK